MEKLKNKSWLITGLLAIALVFTMGFAFLGLPANTQTAYAASNDVTLTAEEIYNSVSDGNYTIANTYGTWTIIGTKDTEINYRKPNSEETKISTFPGATHTFTLTFTPKSQYKVVKAVLSVTIGISQHPTCSISFNDIPISVATNAGLFDISETDTTYCTSHDTIFTMTCYSTNNSEALGTTNLQVTVTCELNAQSVTIAKGDGVKEVYLSTSQNATSGSASGTEFNANTTVYGFAKLAKGYKHKDGWTLVSGTADTENAIYRVGSKTVGDSTVNFGTISADTIKYSISYDLKGGQHGTTHPGEYYVTTNTFTISNPTRIGYTFTGWTGSNGTIPQTNLQIAKGSIGNRTYTANWVANKYNINYFDQGGDPFVGAHEEGYKAQHTYDSVTVLDNPTRAGHTFLGWHKEADCSDDVVTEIGEKEYVEAFNLYAKWTHNVLIVAGDGISEVYVSTKSYDLTGVPSGTEYENETEVYGYAKLEKGYNAPSNWTLVDGKSNSEGAIYRIGSGIVNQDGYDFGTIVALPNHYYVMFEDESYVVATYGENLPNLNEQTLPTKTGYTFIGFFDAQDGEEGTKYYNANGTGACPWDKTEITTLYAHFDVTDYTITYTMNGGTVETENPATYTYFDEDITLVNPSKTGYTFIGWTGTGLEENTMEVVIEKNSLGDKTFVANFKQNEYKANIDGEEVDVVYDANMPQITPLAQKGYTLHGYFDEENGQGTKYYNADGTSAHIWDKTEDAELYPYFTPNPYIVTINGNEYNVTFDDAAEDLPELEEEDILTQTGYTFDGYYYEPAEGEAVKYYNADGTGAHVWDIDDNVTLVAHFVINEYTITFDSNGGSEVEAITQEYNTDVEEPEDPEKTGYTFVGWYADEDLIEEYEFTTMPAENITVYAKWDIIEYTIEYTLNDGTVATDNPTKYTVENEDITLVNPSKTGYTFIGWTGTDLDEETLEVVISAGAVGNRVYTARFVINEYTITFDSNGGSEVEAITQEYNTDVEESEDPEKTGYTFVGWYADEDLTEEYEFTTMPAADITLYAKWMAREFTVTYGDNTVTATYDADMPTITAPTKTGYTFHGYFDEEEGQGTQYYNADGTSAHIWDKAEEGELIPYWTINSYKVEISEVKGTKQVYTALSPIAKNGNESGHEYEHGTQVNAFAVLDRGYSAPNTWVLLQGTANTEGALYYIAQVTVNGADYDFSDYYETEGIPNKCVAVFDGTRPVEVIFGEQLNDLTEEEIPTKTGYSFDGYYINENQYFDADGKCVRAWDIEGAGQLTAKWVAKNYIATVGDQEIEVVFYKEMPALETIPTKEGYTFDAACDENNVKYYDAEGQNAHVWDKLENAELVIIWKVNKYTITFVSNGGSDVEKITNDYGADVVAPTEPTKENSTFAGWYADEDLTEEYEFTTMPAADITLYAKWVRSVANVIDLIDEIDDVEYTTESKDKIEEALEAYQSLSDDDKELVDNYQALVDALNEYAQLEADHTAADEVIELIEAIGDVEYTTESKAKIDEADEAYDQLTPAQKALVTNHDDLDEAKEFYDAVDEVVKEIAAIGESSDTTEFRNKVNSARDNFDNLTDDQEAIVPEETIKTLTDDEAAIRVMDKINEIGAIEYTASKDKIDAAREAYDDLDDDQKDLVANYDKLVQDEEVYKHVDEVTKKIDQIGEVEYNKETKEKIDEARKAYDNLTDEEKGLVPNVDELEVAEKTYAKYDHDHLVAIICAIVFSILGFFLVYLLIVYLLAFFKYNDWIIKDDKVIRAHVCKKADKKGRNVITCKLCKLTREENEIYDTKEKALEALNAQNDDNNPDDDNDPDDDLDDELEIGKDGFASRFANKKSRSFEEKLNALSNETKAEYEALRDEVLAYNGTKIQKARGFETVRIGRNPILKFVIKGKTLCVYYNLDVEGLNSKYKVEKVNSKKFASTPCLYRIKNDRRFGYAKELIALVAEKNGLAK